MRGIKRCYVGYAAEKDTDGDEKPTYRRMLGFTESIRLEFDPEEISFDEILSMFFQSHNPGIPMPRQYMSAIWTHSEAQKSVAKAHIKRLKREHKQKVVTVVKACAAFYRAEDYHQKWYLRKVPALMAPFKDVAEREFEDSTFAARFNAVAAGDGFDRLLDETELDALEKLPAGIEARREYESRVAGKKGPVAGACRRL